MIPDHIVEQVKDATDLPELVREYGVALQKVAGGYLAKCCFHNEKTASLRINTVGDRKGRFICFGCSAAGDVVNFMMRKEGVGYLEALRKLADRAGLSLLNSKVTRVQAVANKEDTAFSKWWWAQKHATVLSLLDQAMLDADLAMEDEWADTLGRMLRNIEAMKPAEKLQQFAFNVTGKERMAWREETAWDKGFAEAWVGLAGA